MTARAWATAGSGPPPRAARASHSGSSVRCSSRNANDSVTELSPRWRNSNAQLRVGVRVVLGVAALVEERPVVVAPARRRDHQVDLAGHARRRAEGARRLGRPRLGVEVDVGLAPQVDAEPGERRRRTTATSRSAGNIGVEVRGAKEARQVGSGEAPRAGAAPRARAGRRAPPGRRPRSPRGSARVCRASASRSIPRSSA